MVRRYAERGTSNAHLERENPMNLNESTVHYENGPTRHACRGPRHGRTGVRRRGFTLIELIVVITIIGILAAIAVVQVRNAQRKAQETALADDLHELRKAIDNFYADKQRYPSDLNELVPNYLRKIPSDPITRQADWETIQDQPNPEEAADTSMGTSSNTLDQPQGPGIVDVKSKAVGKTLGGVSYSDL